MPTVHANGIDIRYEVLRPVAQGPRAEQMPLVLTHGFAGPVDNWLPELAPLIEQRAVVMYDVRGHGRTTVPPDPAAYSLPTFAADLSALLRAIGIERAHIGGVSMGGMITAQFAVDHPDLCESVLLCDATCGNASAPLSTGAATDGPAGDWERRMAVGITALAHMAQECGLEETIRREQAFKLENDPHLDESPYTFEGDFERIKLMTVPGYLGAAHAIAQRPDLTARIPAIAAPTLVMAGEWDDFLPCALRDHGLIPGSRLVVRQRCAHGSGWRPETFVSEVLGFLEDVETGRPVAGKREV
jgi:pimeloyl-ACP methyl ester carboxylesterase